jgi:hypothetical protein
MKHRLASWLRSLAIIAGVTLLLDFSITAFIPNAYLEDLRSTHSPDDANYRTGVPWHHELKPDLRTQRYWGPIGYPFASDELGFRTGACAGSDPRREHDNTVFVVGDSFTEGIAVPFEESFAGLLACAYREHGMVVRNLGTLGYSPTIYYRKIEESVRRLGFAPREIIVFLDMSDVHNDAVDFTDLGNTIVAQAPTAGRKVKEFLKRNFMSASLASKLWLTAWRHYLMPPVSTLADWTSDPGAFERWGRAGLAANERNLQRIVDQCGAWKCRMTLVVYPWPPQILQGDQESLQVRHWRAWSAARDIRFVNAFPPFFTLPPKEAVARYYIDGDVHFTAAGNRLLFDAVWPSLRPAN